MDEIFLRPGEIYFGDRPARIRTLLGSCVSITVWHPQRQMGGMCHFMLPSRGSPKAGEPDGRYADEAMTLFLREIGKRGCQPAQFQVKLFGGGNMFGIRPDKGRRGFCLDVPSRNWRAARTLVRHYGFTVVAEDLGGNGHRQLVFDMASGDVWVRRNRDSLRAGALNAERGA